MLLLFSYFSCSLTLFQKSSTICLEIILDGNPTRESEPLLDAFRRKKQEIEDGFVKTDQMTVAKNQAPMNKSALQTSLDEDRMGDHSQMLQKFLLIGGPQNSNLKCILRIGRQGNTLLKCSLALLKRHSLHTFFSNDIQKLTTFQLLKIFGSINLKIPGESVFNRQ